ncbi:MAG: 16S rRNA (guanine(527)-N(7))-methyltransferase RsmG [Fusobacterium perfoetens]|uniref:16S rRNA (guanine(527)-N(7))-methyltransferase RsmG n=1 Tax=Fusobacterium perfoetens TaxID=852 RepID=UPI0023F29D5B|nr:16S rRNA (guanine(527)-N(7))-methyltransferase RsmG [Fusobacterium perfoetens]MCI6153417.1 16S rRNA (guanine(527)-N(7))-methyltransferase RsmG [Fusobacterium perfoetens]MDY3238440.1 16S rRNA (guanine(527)-N(7))-methyltransferase RsmG [Fusobacterium perfoetens]
MKEFLKDGIKKIGLDISDEKIDNLMEYLKLLIEYNSHTNLTAIRDEEGIIEKHFLDSLLIMKYMRITEGKAIDIGTGAGFPGMVLAICNPQIKFTLIDSVGKKINFLKQVIEKLGLSNVEAINVRAEEFINEKNRETYDIGLCRGVSKLNIILEYVIPFLKVNGRFLPQKMEGTNEEKDGENALKVLNSKIEKIYIDELPYIKDKRVIIDIIKLNKTNKKYPRANGVPSKKPL